MEFKGLYIETSIFIKAVGSVVNDPSFQVCSSSQAKAAIATASNVLQWSSMVENKSKLEVFCNMMICMLKKCFKQGKNADVNLIQNAV